MRITSISLLILALVVVIARFFEYLAIVNVLSTIGIVIGLIALIIYALNPTKYKQKTCTTTISIDVVTKKIDIKDNENV